MPLERRLSSLIARISRAPKGSGPPMRWATPLLVPAVVASIVIGGCSSSDEEILSQDRQAELPTMKFALGSALCPGPPLGLRKQVAERRYSAQIKALIRALKESPNALVTATFASSDEGPGGLQTEQISVRELAESHLIAAQDSRRKDCWLDFRNRIERALRGAE